MSSSLYSFGRWCLLFALLASNVGCGSGGGDTGGNDDGGDTILNALPIANDDIASTDEDAVLMVSAANGLLLNDSDPDNDSLTVITSPITEPTNGLLILSADGSFSYTPNANYAGVDSFIYTISDGNGGSAQATVSITVIAVNDFPIANDDAASVDEDVVLTVSSENGLLSNDSDIDDDSLTVTTAPITEPVNGSLVLSSDGSYSYTPNPDFNGTDTFVYEISDGNNDEINDGNRDISQATVIITVNPVDDAPEFTSLTTVSVIEGTTATGYIAQADDPDGDELSYSISDGEDMAVFIIDENSGALSFTTEPAFNPAGDSNGDNVYLVSIGVSDENSQVELSLEVTLISAAEVINFNDYTIESYSSGDEVGEVTIEDEGYTLKLKGNIIKAIEYSYTVTANTMLEFDFSSPEEGEFHAIAFDTQLAGLTQATSFNLYGSQADWGLEYFNYYYTDGVYHYSIPVGDLFTGEFQYLGFIMDDDSSKSGESVFSNIRIYESGSPVTYANLSVQCGDETVNYGADGRGLPLLESHPEAPVTIYLDFHGGSFNGVNYIAYGSDGLFDETEQVNIVCYWKNVIEHFAMFDINVTTSNYARKASNAWSWTLTGVDWVGGAFGLAQLGGFGTFSSAVSYVAKIDVNIYNAGIAAHEIGHNFGLLHQGTYTDGSYNHDSDALMGSGSSGSAWRIGQYEGGGEDGIQDNIETIRQKIMNYSVGDGWRPDDLSDFRDIDAVTIDEQNTGIIEQPGDSDVIAIDHAGGDLTITVSPLGVSSIDTVLTVYNDVDVVLDGPVNVNASFESETIVLTSLSAGRYYLVISSPAVSTAYNNSGYNILGAYIVETTGL